MHTIQIEEVMILHFVKHVSKVQILRAVSKNYIVDVFIKLVIMRRIFSDVTPQYDLTCILIKVQRLQHKHDVLDVIRKLFDHKLIVVQMLSIPAGQNMQLEAVDVNIKRAVLPGF